MIVEGKSECERKKREEWLKFEGEKYEIVTKNFHEIFKNFSNARSQKNEYSKC